MPACYVQSKIVAPISNAQSWQEKLDDTNDSAVVEETPTATRAHLLPCTRPLPQRLGPDNHHARLAKIKRNECI